MDFSWCYCLRRVGRCTLETNIVKCLVRVYSCNSAVFYEYRNVGFYLNSISIAFKMDEFDCWSIAYEFIVNDEIDMAISLCETDVCSNSLSCQRFLGWTYYNKRDMEKALSWFSKAANQNDGEALFGIGSVLVVNENFQSAASYFERAARNGYHRGYHWAGSIYHRGSGVAIDVDKAITYYRQGAAHGYIMAERSLISLEMEKGNILVKFVLAFKFIALLVKAVRILFLNIDDPRVIDVPNYFKK